MRDAFSKNRRQKNEKWKSDMEVMYKPEVKILRKLEGIQSNRTNYHSSFSAFWSGPPDKLAEASIIH